jgi:hypothetical protein
MPQNAEHSESDIPTKNQSTNNTESVGEEHEVLLCSYCQEAKDVTRQQTISKPYFQKGNNISAEELEALAIEDNTDTAWETELRKYRMMR